MSSLAATQADGYYVPTAYFDSGAYQKQSRNQFAAKQLNSKRQGHNQFLQNNVVRFELPHDGVCGTCGNWSTKGERMNAKKIKTELSYFTTIIWEFRMTCRACACQEFVIRTDPANQDFVYVSGIRRRTASIEDQNETPLSTDVIESNVVEQIEASQTRQRNNLNELERLKVLQQVSEKTYLLDADRNAGLRDVFRVHRTDRKRRLAEGAALGWRKGMPLLDSVHTEQSIAKKVLYKSSKTTAVKNSNTAKLSIFSSPFSNRQVEISSRKRTRLSNVTSSFTKPGCSFSSSKVISASRRVHSFCEEKMSVKHDDTLTLQCTTTDEEKKKKRIIVLLPQNGTFRNDNNVLKDNTANLSPPPSAVDFLSNYESDSE